MPTPFEIFQQRFGGQPQQAYNPFQGAPSYTSGYTPGQFGGTPAGGGGTPAGGGINVNPGTLPITGQGGGRPDNAEGLAGDRKPGYQPGYSNGAAVAGTLLGMAIPGAGLLTSVGNGLSGVAAADEQAKLMSQITGKPINLSAGDYLSAGTGGMLGDSPYEKGLGGYGQIGMGGYTGMQNMMDPGVMGAARAQSASVVNANNPAGPITPTSGTGLLSPGTAPTAAPAAGLLSAPKAPALSSSQIQQMKNGITAGLPKEDRILAGQAFDQSIKNLTASGGLTASAVSQAAQLAKSGKTLQSGKSGVSGSQIGGGKTVGNNPNDRSGRNPGAPSGAGAGGRLGGGV